MRSRTQYVFVQAAGYTLVEVLVVLGVIAVLSAITVLVMPIALLSGRADSGAAGIVSVLRVAREQAIAQRRTVRVAFNGPNQIVISRVEVPGPGTTPINTVWLEGGMTFRVFGGVPDTPDAFGNGAAASFDGADTIAFTSMGEFVDQNGDPVNGTVFIGREHEPLSARAVSVFGPTALVREWRWNGARWTN
jgi:prepilin-type N-terminal cleavage/methylation domain-containing protein